MLLPLATIYAYSHTQPLPFLDFLLPCLAKFNSIRSATFLYNLFVKAFKERVFFILPDTMSNSGVVDEEKGQSDAFHFILCGPTDGGSTNDSNSSGNGIGIGKAPYFVHIEIGIDAVCDAVCNTGSGVGVRGVAVTLVETRNNLFHNNNNNSSSRNMNENKTDTNSNNHSSRSHSHRGEVESTLRSQRVLIDNLVQLVLYAANILLAQQ